ncbi:polyprenyl synthetase family protein [Microbispora sp. SCL1-1]|uniref:polyprenyl synthetase family protein n=1 Tax=Microbispora TaxID=2005 RepID=UPI001158C7B6|nr:MULTISPECIES: polyprenyl synthetase family protein [unclassified Microbispora]NJP26233.1 polyprenyl synthetase family protein [Microbispora sp. CL1-1]TQS12657.1 polyprenyl synthetase family protein [Microbispora sp. SCL1-1]
MTADTVDTSIKGITGVGDTGGVAAVTSAVRGRVDELLAGFLDARRPPVGDPDVAEGYRLLREFVVDGGKRIRPLLCYWGWRGAGGEEAHDDRAVVTGAALELYHAGLLIHDDVMDGSELRRGRPTIHRGLAGTPRWTGAEAFGRSAAILLGVLAQAWADELIADAAGGDVRGRAARELFNRMRTEVVTGQYLDILAHARADADVERALTVIRYKTARYTVERPLQIGAALAGAPPALLEAYSRFGLPLGEAFQLRDDVLGVFGDPAVTGKPVLDDLREGKRTVLMAYAYARARGPERDLLRTWHGASGLDEHRAAELRRIIVDTGALGEVEDLIAVRTGQALDALRECAIAPEAAQALTMLTERLTRRVR